MESFFGHLKEEALRQFNLLSFDQTKELIDLYIYFYTSKGYMWKQGRHLINLDTYLDNLCGAFLFVSYLVGVVHYEK